MSSFGKNILSSAIGSTLGLLVAGTVLIFIFVGVLVGGLVGALADDRWRRRHRAAGRDQGTGYHLQGLAEDGLWFG